MTNLCEVCHKDVNDMYAHSEGIFVSFHTDGSKKIYHKYCAHAMHIDDTWISLQLFKKNIHELEPKCLTKKYSLDIDKKRKYTLLDLAKKNYVCYVCRDLIVDESFIVFYTANEYKICMTNCLVDINDYCGDLLSDEVVESDDNPFEKAIGLAEFEINENECPNIVKWTELNNEQQILCHDKLQGYKNFRQCGKCHLEMVYHLEDCVLAYNSQTHIFMSFHLKCLKKDIKKLDMYDTIYCPTNAMPPHKSVYGQVIKRDNYFGPYMKLDKVIKELLASISHDQAHKQWKIMKEKYICQQCKKIIYTDDIIILYSDADTWKILHDTCAVAHINAPKNKIKYVGYITYEVDHDIGPLNKQKYDEAIKQYNIKFNSKVCHGCNKIINNARTLAVCYKNNTEHDIMHWNCFIGTYSNTHNTTYIGAMKIREFDKAIKWKNLSQQKQKSAKALWTKTKMYGDLEIRTGNIHISGMAGDCLGISPDEAGKIIDDSKKKAKTKTQQLFANRKKEWTEAEEIKKI